MEAKTEDPSESPERPWYWVALSEQVSEHRRLHTHIEGRYVRFDTFRCLNLPVDYCQCISVFRVNNALYALDSICYHAGGPLAEGDIEDIDGNQQFTCTGLRSDF